MKHSEMKPEEMVAALLAELEARAAGLWRLDGDRLTQVTFVPGAAMPEDVAKGFAEATKSVPLDDHSLGIVAAARTREVAVSRAATLPANSSSGLWLGKFGACKSVAVPLLNHAGELKGVISIALDSEAIDDDTVAERLRSASTVWVAAAST